MQYLPEILRIIEAGLSSDTARVRSYSDLLIKKMEREGDTKAAERVRKSTESPLSKSGMSPALTRSNSVPVDRDSRFSLADESLPIEEEVTIHLPEYAQSKVDEFLTFVRQSEKLVEAGVGVSPSMLLYGPPGCGKSHLAQHIAASLDLPLLTTRCDSLVSSFLGSTAKNLRSIFEHAAGRPCVLFLDEFDALAKARDDQHELGELKRVVVSLLQNIDALPTETVILAATNHEKLLDPAVWRRFAYHIHLREPTDEIRLQIAQQYLREFAPKSLKTIVRATNGMSGAEIQQACETSIRAAVVNGKAKVAEQQLLNNLVQIQYADLLQESTNVDESIRRLRNEDPKVFTARLLSSLFGVSLGKVSKVINTEV